MIVDPPEDLEYIERVLPLMEKKHKVSKDHKCWVDGYSLEEHVKEASRFNNSPDFGFKPFKKRGDIG